MTWKLIAGTAAALAAGCTGQSAAPADNQTAAANEAATAPANPIEERFDNTMSGQPLAPSPPAPFQLLVTQARYGPGDVIPCHKHPWPRYVYLQAGRLQVTNYDVRRVYEFHAGQILVESIDQWHQGVVTGHEPAIVVAFEEVPRGRDNRVTWPPPPPAENPCRPWAER